MDRHSIKFKFTLVLIALTVILVGLILFINTTFAERYYSQSIQDNMLENYCSIEHIVDSYSRGEITRDEMDDKIETISSSGGISLIIVGSDWSTFYSSNRFDDELIKRLEISIFSADRFKWGEVSVPQTPSSTPPQEEGGHKKRPDKDDAYGIKVEINGVREEREILVQNGNYTLQKIYDTRLSDTYLELWGDISDGAYSILIRHPFQSIKNAVSVTNTFVWIAALAVLLLGVVIVYIFAGFMTRPIQELSQIAGRMAKLDFEAKYTGNYKSELGQLGKSINDMSEELESTISRLKTANLEMKRDLENKEKLEEMRTEFLSNVSHELKTPIALIQGYAEGLREGITQDPENMDYYCDVIIDESAKMNSMVKKLLTLNQLEFGDEELVMERFDLTELAKAVVEANELRAQQKGIRLWLETESPVFVWCDEYKTEEVITNYITNAIHHCEGAKEIRVKITHDENCARLSVFNTGKNIPEAELERIWDKFYKVDKARTREYGGNGIGLSIVRAILESYNNRYGAVNHENGVEFWFELDCKNE